MAFHVAPGPVHISPLTSPLRRLFAGYALSVEVPHDFLLPPWQAVLATSALPRIRGPAGQDDLPADLQRQVFADAHPAETVPKPQMAPGRHGGGRSDGPGGAAPTLVPGVP